MKNTTVFCVLLAIAFSARLIMASNSKGETAQVTESVSVIEDDPNNGMHFNSRNVVDNVWYGTEADGVFYLIYDDVDAEHYYETIRVTEETYMKAVEAMEAETELKGNLHAVFNGSFIEYELREKEEI